MKRLISVMLIVFALSCLTTTAYADAAFHSYTPYTGMVDIYQSGSNRYAEMYMKWNSNGLSEFNLTTDTYEHELIFYNYDDLAYASSILTYQTTLPSSYLDTQEFDGVTNGWDEMNLAVGTSNPTQLVAENQYYIRLQLDGFNSSSSMYKIQAQEGYSLLGIDSKWSIFPESTSTIIPFRSGYTAPEMGRCWIIADESNDTFDTATYGFADWWMSGTLSSQSDVDWIKFFASGSTTIRFDVPNGYDYDIHIYDISGNLLTSMTSDQQIETLTYNFSSAGMYRLKVVCRQYPGTTSTTSPYRIMIE